MTSQTPLPRRTVVQIAHSGEYSERSYQNKHVQRFLFVALEKHSQAKGELSRLSMGTPMPGKLLTGGLLRQWLCCRIWLSKRLLRWLHSFEGGGGGGEEAAFEWGILYFSIGLLSAKSFDFMWIESSLDFFGLFVYGM